MGKDGAYDDDDDDDDSAATDGGWMNGERNSNGIENGVWWMGIIQIHA